jgi:hypothetical protein
MYHRLRHLIRACTNGNPRVYRVQNSSHNILQCHQLTQITPVWLLEPSMAIRFVIVLCMENEWEDEMYFRMHRSHRHMNSLRMTFNKRNLPNSLIQSNSQCPSSLASLNLFFYVSLLFVLRLVLCGRTVIYFIPLRNQNWSHIFSLVFVQY